VTILEARDRIGGRTYTYELEVTDGDTFTVPIDLGASWIHGIGPGYYGIKTHPTGFPGREEPIWRIVEANSISTIQTFDDLYYSNLYFYSYLGGEVDEPEIDLIKEAEKIGRYSYFHKNSARKGTGSVREVVDGYKYKGPEPQTVDVDFLVETLKLAAFTVSSAMDMETESSVESWKGEGYKGVEVIFENGYREVIDIMAEDLDIILEKEVSIIEYPETEKKNQKEYGQIRVETSDSSEYFADKVVVTVPLGVLKSDMITFIPELPEEKV